LRDLSVGITDESLIKYAIEMGSDGMIYIPSFRMIRHLSNIKGITAAF
jgi:hypothetical protein